MVTDPTKVVIKILANQSKTTTFYISTISNIKSQSDTWHIKNPRSSTVQSSKIFRCAQRTGKKKDFEKEEEEEESIKKI